MRKSIFIILLVVSILLSACKMQDSSSLKDSDPEIVETEIIKEPSIPPTNTPISTEPPLCDPSAVNASQVLLSKDFSDLDNGWVEILEENEDIFVHARTEDGVYKFVGRWFAAKGLGQTFPQDIIFEMDIQFNGEIEKTENQLIQQQLNFEYRNTPDYESDGDFYYNFIITGEGFFWFEKTTWKSEDGMLLTHRVRLTEPQPIPNFQPHEVNHLRLTIIGDDTTLYMNDQMITTMTDQFDPKYDEYAINFTALPYFYNGLNPSQTLYEIFVDNLCIYAP